MFASMFRLRDADAHDVGCAARLKRSPGGAIFHRATIPPRMNTTPQRENWNGHPVELGDAWTLRKGTKVARCVLVSHQLGWELRLMVGELRSQVCGRQTKS
jgi:hypothetical protein